MSVSLSVGYTRLRSNFLICATVLINTITVFVVVVYKPLIHLLKYQASERWSCCVCELFVFVNLALVCKGCSFVKANNVISFILIFKLERIYLWNVRCGNLRARVRSHLTVFLLWLWHSFRLSHCTLPHNFYEWANSYYTQILF